MLLYIFLLAFYSLHIKQAFLVFCMLHCSDYHSDYYTAATTIVPALIKSSNHTKGTASSLPDGQRNGQPGNSLLAAPDYSIGV